MADNNYVILDEKPVTGQGWINFGGTSELANYALDPADTPLLFRLRSPTASVPANRFAYAKVKFTGLSWGVGATVTIYGRTFTAAAYPKAGQFFAAFGSDIGIMVESIVTAMNSDPFLGNLFSASLVVTGMGTYLEIVAKQPGSAFNLVNGTNIASSITGFAANTACAPTADNTRAQQLQQWGYGICLKLLVPSEPLNFFDAANIAPGSARWIEIAALVKDYGGNPAVDFDISKYVRAYLSVNLPDPTLATMQRFPQAAQAYKVEWGEYFRGGIDTASVPPLPALAPTDAAFRETEPIYYRSGESEIRWAAPGAFALDLVPPDYYRWWRSITTNGAVNAYGTVLALTERPPSALVRRFTDPLWLYFWLVVDQRTLSYKVRLNYTFTFHDGTTLVQAGAQSTTTQSGLFALHAVPSLTTPEAGGKRVASYVAAVEVDRATGTFTTLCSQSFVLDASTDRQRYRTFYWENRFGVLDSFTFEGIGSTAIDVVTTTFERGISQQRGLNTAAGKTRVFEEATIAKQATTSGWVDRAHADYLAAMLRARNVWTLDTVSYYDEGLGRQVSKKAFVSVLLTAHVWNTNDRDKLFNLGIEYQKATPENSRLA